MPSQFYAEIVCPKEQTLTIDELAEMRNAERHEPLLTEIAAASTTERFWHALARLIFKYKIRTSVLHGGPNALPFGSMSSCVCDAKKAPDTDGRVRCRSCLLSTFCTGLYDAMMPDSPTASITSYAKEFVSASYPPVPARPVGSKTAMELVRDETEKPYLSSPMMKCAPHGKLVKTMTFDVRGTSLMLTDRFPVPTNERPAFMMHLKSLPDVYCFDHSSRSMYSAWKMMCKTLFLYGMAGTEAYYGTGKRKVLPVDETMAATRRSPKCADDAANCYYCRMSHLAFGIGLRMCVDDQERALLRTQMAADADAIFHPESYDESDTMPQEVALFRVGQLALETGELKAKERSHSNHLRSLTRRVHSDGKGAVASASTATSATRVESALQTKDTSTNPPLSVVDNKRETHPSPPKKRKNGIGSAAAEPDPEPMHIVELPGKELGRITTPDTATIEKTVAGQVTALVKDKQAARAELLAEAIQSANDPAVKAFLLKCHQVPYPLRAVMDDTCRGTAIWEKVVANQVPPRFHQAVRYKLLYDAIDEELIKHPVFLQVDASDTHSDEWMLLTQEFAPHEVIILNENADLSARETALDAAHDILKKTWLKHTSASANMNGQAINALRAHFQWVAIARRAAEGGLLKKVVELEPTHLYILIKIADIVGRFSRFVRLNLAAHGLSWTKLIQLVGDEGAPSIFDLLCQFETEEPSKFTRIWVREQESADDTASCGDVSSDL